MVVKWMTPCVYAGEMTDKKKTDNLNNLKAICMKPGLSTTPIEASGIFYVADIKKSICVSDETDYKQPVLFVMNDTGYIENKIDVENMPEINDMEGITQDGNGFFYLLSSQSYNNKGKQPASRKILAQVLKKGSRYICQKRIQLWDVLLAAANQCTSQAWSIFIIESAKEKSVDIEGITFFGDTLLLGFKNPKIDNRAVILGIADVNALFGNGTLTSNQIGIWRKLPLFDSTSGTFCGISDMYVHKGHVVGLSTGVSERLGVQKDTGLMWDYNAATGTMNILRHFPGLKPEGISYNGNNNEFCIVFDNGSKNPSFYMKVKAHL
jgi:hypothetical protein